MMKRRSTMNKRILWVGLIPWIILLVIMACSPGDGLIESQDGFGYEWTIIQSPNTQICYEIARRDSSYHFGFMGMSSVDCPVELRR